MSFTLFITAFLLTVSSLKSQDLDNEELPRRNERNREVKVFVDVHNHPKTSFTCVDKKAGEYYADIETNCAVYYICIANQYNKLAPISFACPNGTIFNQATRVCTPHEQISCDLATRYYDAQRGYIDSKDKDPSLFSPIIESSKPWTVNINSNINTRPRSQSVPQENRRPIEEPPRRAPQEPTNRRPVDESLRRPPQESRRPVDESPRRPLQETRRPPTEEIRRPNVESRRPTSERRPLDVPLPHPAAPLPPVPQPLPPYQPPPPRFIPPNLLPQRFSQPLSPPATPQPLPIPNIAPASRPLFNVPPRRAPIRLFSSNPSTTAASTTTTTTTTTSTTIAPPVEYVYDYVDYDANTGATIPPQNSPSRRKRSNDDVVIRRKGTLPTIPSDYVTTTVPEVGVKDTDFTCTDKVAGLAYADIANDCRMLHICLPIGKGKFDDHRVFCKSGYGYNQKTGVCDLLANFDCKRSFEYFVYDKFANHDLYRKNLMKQQFRKKSTPKPITSHSH